MDYKRNVCDVESKGWTLINVECIVSCGWFKQMGGGAQHALLLPHPVSTLG